MAEHSAAMPDERFSPLGIAQTIAAGEAIRCDMACAATSSARVSVSCLALLDAEAVVAGAAVSGSARLETGSCAQCPRLTTAVVDTLKRVRQLGATLEVDDVGFADDAGFADNSRAAGNSRAGSKLPSRKRRQPARPAPALSRRDLFRLGLGRKENAKEPRKVEPEAAFEGVRLGASAREVYLAAIADPLLPSVEIAGSCTACEVCVHLCPENALIFDGEALVFEPSQCSECGLCEAKCPEEVLALGHRRTGREFRVLTSVEAHRCEKCSRPLGPRESAVCHNCSTLSTLTNGIWDVYEEKL